AGWAAAAVVGGCVALGPWAWGSEQGVDLTVDERGVAAASEVPPPPGVDAGRVEAMGAAERAGLAGSLTEVVAGIEEPAFLNNRGAIDPLRAQQDPPLEAQRAYARARALLKERRAFDALRELRQAARLAPQDAPVAKLMAQVQAAGGNTAQAVVLLERAAVLDPGDAEVWLELGRLALGGADSGKAVWLLERCGAALAAAEEAGEPMSGATRTLLDYHLGVALSRVGQPRLALERYEAYLGAEPGRVAASGQGRLLGLLEGARWQTLVSVGDLYLRLDEASAAVRAYESALEALREGAEAEGAVRGRLVYARLRSGDVEGARRVVAGALDAGRWGDGVGLMRYLQAAGVSVEALVAVVRSAYEAGEVPGSLTVAVSELLPRSEAAELLGDRLAAMQAAGAEDADLAGILNRLLGLVLGDEPGAEGVAVGEALGLLERAWPGDAGAQRLLVAALIRRAGPEAVVAAIDGGDVADGGGVASLVEGVAREATGDRAGARGALERATREPATAWVARVELATIWMREGMAEEALAALAGVDVASDVPAGRLKAAVLTRLGRGEEALALLDALIGEAGGDVGLLLQRAELEIASGDAAAAERTLLEVINLAPEHEGAYAALFELYNRDAPGLDDTTGRYQRLMRRLLGRIPDSRLGRLKRAEWAEVNRNYVEAERLLRGLMDEEPRDYEALSLWAEVMRSARRGEEATRLIEGQLAADPGSVVVMAIAEEHFRLTGQRDAMLDMRERMLASQPDSLNRALGLAGVYLRQGRLDEAEAELRGALERWGGEAGASSELSLTLAVVLQRKGREAEAVAMKRRVLEDDPTHAPTANDLAYHFALEGVELDEALKLATMAARAEPGNAAYVDTLGWVYYKLGRFEEAVAELGRAVALARQQERREGLDLSETRAVVNDHLGDANYRLGRVEDARRAWQRALRLAPEGPGDGFDPELSGLRDRLRGKLAALAAGEPAAVAETPGVEIIVPVPEAAATD
ncbi:MAG: tetratricopeptide repeat protein, partial [Planctomycetota bacterium]